MATTKHNGPHGCGPSPASISLSRPRFPVAGRDARMRCCSAADALIGNVLRHGTACQRHGFTLNEDAAALPGDGGAAGEHVMGDGAVREGERSAGRSVLAVGEGDVVQDVSMPAPTRRVPTRLQPYCRVTILAPPSPCSIRTVATSAGSACSPAYGHSTNTIASSKYGSRSPHSPPTARGSGIGRGATRPRRGRGSGGRSCTSGSSPVARRRARDRRRARTSSSRSQARRRR
jgi:hypothetical protein